MNRLLPVLLVIFVLWLSLLTYVLISERFPGPVDAPPRLSWQCQDALNRRVATLSGLGQASGVSIAVLTKYAFDIGSEVDRVCP